MGGDVVLANRPEHQPRPRAGQEPADGDDHDQREIDEGTVAEQHPPEWVAGERVRKQLTELRDRHADIARADQRREADTEDRERQSRRDLIGAERQHQDRKQHRGGRACEPSRDHADPGRPVAEVGPIVEGDGEAGHRADQHHPFDAEIEDSALFDHEFADRGQKDRRGDADHGDERVDEKTDAHAVAPAGTVTLGASRTTRMRYRTRMSLARMKNSIVAWKMPAVASGTCTADCATWPPT